jgi:hypothetical protein
MNRFSFPIKDQPLTDERLRQAASYMANLIIAYDFEYITHHVPDVRNMVEYLEEHIYRALTQVEWRVQLKEYFEDLRNISVPNSEDYQVFDASITLLEDVREIYQKERTVEER